MTEWYIDRVVRTSEVDIVAEWWCSHTTGKAARRDELTTESAEALGARVVQAAECRVDGRRVVILYAVFPKFAGVDKLTLVQGIGRVFNPLPPLLVVNDGRPGHVTVDEAFLGTADGAWTDAAMAAAVLHASWAWDESSEICIAGAAGRLIVAPRFEQKRWVAALVTTDDGGL